MPYRKRIQVKKEIQPIQIETQWEKIWSAVKKRKTPLLILFGGVLLFFIAFLSYSFIEGQSEKKAEEMEYAADAEYSKKNRLTGAEQEKQVKSAIELYNKIIATYPKSRSASLAYYYLGNAWIDLKDYEKGIDYYNKAINYPLDGALRGLVDLRLGYAYLNRNDKEQALKVFKRVEQNDKAKNRDLASFEVGQIYESEGKKGEALSQYEAVVKAYPSSPLSAEATLRIGSLKGPEAVGAAQGTAPSSQSK